MLLLSLNDVSMSFAERTLFSGVSLDVYDNDRIGFVGINGSGKTTLFRMLRGEHIPDEGAIHIAGSCKIGVMEQFACKDSDKTLYDEALTVFEWLEDMELELEELHDRIDGGDHSTATIERQTLLTERFEREGGLTYKSRTQSALMGLGFSEGDLKLQVSVLSGGQRSKLQLTKLLLSDANLLLLDEPTNHLDIQSVEWLEKFLNDYRGAYIVISHDRYFLDDVVDRIFAFEGNGKLTQYEGGYTDYAEAKARKYGAGSSEIGAGTGSSLSDKAASGNNSTEDEGKKPTRKDWKQGQKSEKLKFTYKEEREYAVIDEDIARLEEKIARLENDMMANATNSVKLREIMADKEAVEKQLEEKMDRWVYLNDLAEQIEAQKNNG